MSTTSIYGAMFLIPIAMTDTPLGFSILYKGDDDNGNPTYYSYNEYMALDGNMAHYTPSGTHALLSENITSTYLRDDVLAMLQDTPFVFMDGKDINHWQDVDQSLYVWCITTDRRMAFNYYEFEKVSPLYQGVTV